MCRVQAVAALLTATVLLTLSMPTSPAHAGVSVKKAIWGPLDVNGQSQFGVYADLGVGILEMNLDWASVAAVRPAIAHDPADPAYRWPTEIDEAVTQGGPQGITVALLVMGTPAWANGGRPPRFAPTNPADYAQFVEAAARRYPAVRHWIIWGEPTKATNFQPLAPGHARPLRGRALRGAHLYARMLDASYATLKRVNRRNLVIGGNSYTVGTVSPLRWVQALRLPNGRPPRMDLYGHNPFSARRPVLSEPPLGGGLADFGDLDTLAAWLDRYLRRSRPDGRKLRLFLSEYTLPTDHANFEFSFYVTRATQARWISDALRVVRGWPRIYTFGYLGLYDDPLRPAGDQVERGLLQRDGTPKLAYEAFKRG
jgi:hypothetical protein